MDPLDVLRSVDFDWTMHVRGVWTDSRFSAPDLNKEFREDILQDFSRLIHSKESFSLLGRVILGPAGAGKTHFLGELRKEVFRRSAGFVLVDMTDVDDFFETVAFGYLTSLGQPWLHGTTQARAVFYHLLGMVNVTLDGKKLTRQGLIEKIPGLTSLQVQQLREKIIFLLRKKYPEQAAPPSVDVIRAFLLFNSEDFREKDLGYLWLQGHSIGEEERRAHGFNLAGARHSDIIRGLSWLMSLKFPVLLALDQFDAIVAEHSSMCGSASGKGAAGVEERKALAVIEKTAAGLMALRDITSRTLTVAACLESTWAFFQSKALRSSIDRFKPPLLLGPMGREDIVKRIIGSRLAHAYSRLEFVPAYPTWPIKPDAFDTAREFFPRDILKWCDNYRRRCLRTKTIVEVESFDETPGPAWEAEPLPSSEGALGRVFKAFYDRAPVGEVVNQDNEDDLFGPLVRTACRCLVRETIIRDGLDVAVETRFPGGAAYSTLHARVSVIDRDLGDRERHFSIRALQKNNSRAFQARLRAAVTASGIGSGFGFRHLVILRSFDVPSGTETLALLDAFKRSGGILETLSSNHIRSLWALSEMEKQRHPDFDTWLRREKIVTGMGYFRQLTAWLTEK